jgi:hypothetical protein
MTTLLDEVIAELSALPKTSGFLDGLQSAAVA